MTTHIEQHCRDWVNAMVVGQNLCPFAKRSLDANGVRFKILEGSLDTLADVFLGELQLLDMDERVETTLLIIPQGLEDFMDYLDILEGANQMLDELGYEGVYQIASFHPRYQFENTAEDAPSNYTNRAPFPILHLLREASIEKAIEAYGRENAERIPHNNIDNLERMGLENILALLRKSS
ncbi:MAG TPA: DUF1415 domain-containing protein [Pseudomonadales bacterium]|nr:DUF1415 domain-containing protein [Pseudomonadales bacterium]